MRHPKDNCLQGPEAGGITIIVTLMLLVLITIAAMGMSRNALREVAISGTSRQGAMARNVADSGVEWCTYWMDLSNSATATGTAAALSNLKEKLRRDPSLAGRAYDPITQNLYPSVPPTPPADTTLGAIVGTTQGFTAALTRMGKLPITDISQGVAQGAYAPATGSVPLQAPDLWAIRSDGQVTVGTIPFATTFFHAKEAWVSTPAQ